MSKSEISVFHSLSSTTVRIACCIARFVKLKLDCNLRKLRMHSAMPMILRCLSLGRAKNIVMCFFLNLFFKCVCVNL